MKTRAKVALAGSLAFVATAVGAVAFIGVSGLLILPFAVLLSWPWFVGVTEREDRDVRRRERIESGTFDAPDEPSYARGAGDGSVADEENVEHIKRRLQRQNKPPHAIDRAANAIARKERASHARRRRPDGPLEDLSRTRLTDLAEARGIRVRADLEKSELIEILRRGDA
jgi:hypothetical protein